MLCPCCFSFFLPGNNCKQKFYSLKRIQRLKRKKKNSISIKNIIFLSQLTIEACEVKTKKKPKHLLTTFQCKKCKTLVVHDTTPLEFVDFKSHKPTTSNPSNRKSLQKVLLKSQIPKSNSSDKKELDLESFLQGFL